ncbi:DUF5074 domain-containing protein [Alistipes sp.]|uniref:DUF5074 domain-containing protein n=1 Tax=Alistipes sp. TaxID=1872444 RepID=UPI0025BCE907|nr:DUF5074 domain-containing protein [Alistipes sp.]MCI7139916.1 hypothetical protein [Alistipes sp.]MDY5396904.1 hypothetical protein [Alistipes sp.]
MNFRYLIPALWAVAALCGCTTASDGGDTTPKPTPGGYADPDGVWILNQGAPRMENGSLTWIAPDGTVEEQVYRTVNGSAFGNTAQDLWCHDGKIYILSNNTTVPDKGSGEAADGSLVIVDAETFRREKVFRFEELTFPRPEGSTEEDEYLPLTTPLENIAVIDPHNVFISDEQGLFRLDVTTGEMHIVEGSYAFGNQGSTIEAIASTRGMTVVGDRLYSAGGGFWSSTKLFEFQSGRDAVVRSLDLQGEFVSGICRTGDRELLVATCGRSGSTNSFLTFVDLDTWSVKLEKPVKADISAEFMNSSGVTLSGDYLYFAAGTMTVSRLSLKTWKIEEYIHVSDDAPGAAYLTCNVVADPVKNLLYVSVSDQLGEAIVSDGNVLVYDCSGDEPRLVMNLENRASYPVNIYPVSRFR